MNDTPDTLECEGELRSRLADLAATTTLDDQAWEKIQDRIASGPPTRPTPWQLLAMAAAVVVVIAAIVLTRYEERSRVETENNTTTTTDHDTSSRTEQEDPTTTVVPESGNAPSPVGDDNTPAGDRADWPAIRDTAAPDGPPTVEGPGTSTSSTTTPPVATTPDGRIPAVRLTGEGYTVEATVWRDQQVATNLSELHMDLWQADPYRQSLSWGWSDWPGISCVVGITYQVDLSEAGDHVLSWGLLVRNEATDVRMVLADQSWTSAVIGPEVFPGYRPWLGESPLGQEVDHFEARDSDGNLLHLASGSTSVQEDVC